MNEEHKYIAGRLKERAEKLLADVPERLKVVQAAEDDDAELTGRQPRIMAVDPLVEIPFPVLSALLDDIGDAPPADVAEIVTSYRRSAKFHRNVGATNVLARQLLQVMQAADGGGRKAKKGEPASA